MNQTMRTRRGIQEGAGVRQAGPPGVRRGLGSAGVRRGLDTAGRVRRGLDTAGPPGLNTADGVGPRRTLEG